MTPSFQLREFTPADSDACLTLFREAVHRVNCRDYSPDQIDAWAPVDIDREQWTRRFHERIAYVAVLADRVVGFADMSTEGHLDRLFVSADHQRQGIARQMMQMLIDRATEIGIGAMTSDVSITAKPFFLASGFEVVAEQSVECRGLMMTNFRMQRAIALHPAE